MRSPLLLEMLVASGKDRLERYWMRIAESARYVVSIGVVEIGTCG